MKYSRREFVKKTSTYAAAITAVNSMLPFGSRPVYAARKLKVGVCVPDHCSVSTVHAKIAGNFKRNGLDVELVYALDMPELTKGLLTKELHAAQIFSPLFFAINSGAGSFNDNASFLVTAQIGGTNGGSLTVGRNSGIRAIEDLKGKTIAMHSPMMVQNLLLQALLVRLKLDPGKDVNLQIVPVPRLIEALEFGEIDAFMNPEPLGAFAEEKGIGEKLLSTKSLWVDHPCCTIAVRKDMYENDRDTYNTLWLSSMESQVVLDDPRTREEVLEWVHKDDLEFAKFPIDGLKKAFVPDRSDFYPFPFQSSGKAVLNMMRDFKLIPVEVEVDQLIADSFLSDTSRKLLESCGEKVPKGNSRKEKILGDLAIA